MTDTQKSGDMMAMNAAVIAPSRITVLKETVSESMQRLGRRLKQATCWHDYLLNFDYQASRVSLKCVCCKKETPGWSRHS